MRPSNDFLQARYPASSSFRVCTLTLPSVVLRIAFISLKVTEGLTASALTMARRVFSWINRSRSGNFVCTGSRRGSGASTDFLAALAIARTPCRSTTVSRCDHPSEDHVQATEADAEEHVCYGEWDKTCGH